MQADLEHMSPEELRSLVDQAQKALEKRQKEEARKVLAEARRLASSVGYEAAFTKAGKQPQASGRQQARKVEPKYRNPKNPGEVWSGRGRQPAWVREALAAGISLERLAITQGESQSRRAT